MFGHLQSYPALGMQLLEANRGILKEEVKHFVKDILQNNDNVGKANFPPPRLGDRIAVAFDP